MINPPSRLLCLPQRPVAAAPGRRGIAALAGHTAALLLTLLAGCSFGPGLAPANLSEPGWTVREGQAVWHRKPDAPELAGEILLATHPDGRTVVQFTKTPLPFVDALTTTNRWQIRFIPQQRNFRGHGVAPVRLIWLHLARSLAGLRPPEPLRFDQAPDGGWRLENERSGESLAGYLKP